MSERYVLLTVAGFLALLAALATLVFGCGGVPREARVALEETAGGLVVADEAIAAETTRKGEEARAQVRREVAEGTIQGSSREETIELGMARFDELMAPLRTAETALRVAREALRAVEQGLDAWAAGTDEGAGFFAAAACAVAALASVGAALLEAELELPDILAQGIGALSGFASGQCPEGS